VDGVGGVYGVIGSSNTANGAGVYAYTNQPSGSGAYGTAQAGGTGVYGISDSGFGVYGTSTSGLGVYGNSSGGYGVLGVSTKVGFAGITGITTTAGVPAFAGGSATPAADAAQFGGGVFIDCTTVAGGKFVVNPMSAKFGTVQHTDGSLRLMASMEAPESWAVDVGEGQLTSGHASVKLDADYAAVIEGAGYRVFVMPEGETKGLYVTNKTASGFEVHESGGGTSSVGFTWLVAAHPRNQKSERLQKFVAPTALHPDLPKPPVPVPAPKRP
jgi:hypothetical protein